MAGSLGAGGESLCRERERVPAAKACAGRKRMVVIGPVASLSRINLALSTMRASALRKTNLAAGAAAMVMRIRDRRAVCLLERADFAARMRSSGRIDIEA